MLLVLLFVWVGWHTTPGEAEVVKSFEETCPQFFFRGTPPKIGLTASYMVPICQRYVNQYRYATLYNQKFRIPIYSAYIYKPGKPKRPSIQMVEPQAELKNSQAIQQDYKNLTYYNRGHLNPNSHQPDLEAKKSTFTLTNIVPQFIKLNCGTWRNYEEHTMRRNTQGCKDTFAVVGAVPGNNYIAGGRVNKPGHLWSAACCYIDNNHLRSWAIIATNDEDRVEELTLGQLEEKLTALYQQNSVSLFHSDCPRK